MAGSGMDGQTSPLFATPAASAAASPFASRAFFSIGGKSVACCDAGAALPEHVVSNLRLASRDMEEEVDDNFLQDIPD